MRDREQHQSATPIFSRPCEKGNGQRTTGTTMEPMLVDH